MKFLFYVEPWVELGMPQWKTPRLDFLFGPLINTILSFNETANTDLFMLIGESQAKAYSGFFEKTKIRYAIITQLELFSIFQDDQDALNAWYLGTYASSEISKMQQLILTKLKGFVPDIIFPYSSPVPFLRGIFKNSLILHSEAGFSTRAPFPQTIYFDPFGDGKNEYLRLRGSDLSEKSDKMSDFLSDYRKRYISLICDSNPFKQVLKNYSFSKYILLPLQFSRHFVFDCHCRFKSQYNFLVYVMNNVPKDIGVIVVEHSPHEYGKVLTDGVRSFFEENYQNFIYSSEFAKYEAPSQYLLSMCDAVVTVSSSIGIQSMMWRKPLIVLGDSFLSSFADKTSLFGLSDYLSNNQYLEKDALLFHLLSHYFVPMPYVLNRAWLFNFLSHALNEFKRGLSQSSFYNRIDSDENLLKFYLDFCPALIPIQVSCQDDYLVKYKQCLSEKNELDEKLREFSAELDCEKKKSPEHADGFFLMWFLVVRALIIGIKRTLKCVLK